MRIFNPDNHAKSDQHKRLYAICEVAYSAIDFSAALLFIVGSVLFFDESTTYIATWLFLVGSVLFGMRPAVKLYREIGYLRLGDYDDIARQ
ncbi:YrhK family protein [Yoonia sp. BS5-3]|uniref:YrhK family protein n=1 Tax=Yoonia phaeophyticola TaxID=3137369 RepID=A0ABZ2V3Q5_9RHOB